MRKGCLFACLLLPLCCLSQVNLKNIRKGGYRVLAYRISAAEAGGIIKKADFDLRLLSERQPAAVFPADSVDEKKLTRGQYALISIRDNRIIGEIIGISDLQIYPVNNRQRVQLLLVDQHGDPVPHARVLVDGREAPYLEDAKTFLVKKRNPDHVVIEAFTENDTLFSSLSGSEDMPSYVSFQRRQKWKRSRLYRTITWIPKTINRLSRPSGNHRIHPSIHAGMIIFNQPKYKPTDTVKLKAYLFDKRKKFYRKPVQVFLTYYDKRKYRELFMKNLEASQPGSYLFSFPLADSLPTDLDYGVELRDNRNRLLLSHEFRLEDYLLDNINSFDFTSSREIYYPQDSLQFYASGSDANGFPLLDGEASLVLAAGDVRGFYQDTLYIPDTLFTQKKPLVTEGNTVFNFAATHLGPADFDIRARLEFKDAGNELHEKYVDVKFRQGLRELVPKIEGDSVETLYLLNGRSVPARGELQLYRPTLEIRQIQYPYKARLEPLVSEYTFLRVDSGKTVDSATISANSSYEVRLVSMTRGDTLGFTLINPYRVRVIFTVLDGSKIIGRGTGDGEKIPWSASVVHKNRAWKVCWQYYWNGKEQTKEESIALAYKLLDIQVKNSLSVFPGQKDSISVLVRDYKDRPAAGVNLTAVSYSRKFGKDDYIPDPPYLVRYRLRPRIWRDQFKEDDPGIIESFPLGLYKEWIAKFGLDSMLYYQMLFPGRGQFDVVTPISDLPPQLSVHMTRNGERQEIYELFINGNLVYYNGVTEKFKDAFQLFPGYARIGVRLRDRFVDLDSIYVQPSYKHDLFFDLDSLPKNAVVTRQPTDWTTSEKSLLENSLFQLDGKIAPAHIWQENRQVFVSANNPHVLGPFIARDSLHFFSPRDFDIHFAFEPGYEYDLSRNIYRLERKNLFSIRAKTALRPVASSEWVIGDTLDRLPVVSYDVRPAEPYLRMTNYSGNGSTLFDGGKLFFTVTKDTLLKYVILCTDDSLHTKWVFPGGVRNIRQLAAGLYRLMLVDYKGNTATIPSLLVVGNQTLCVNANRVVYERGNPLLSAWVKEEKANWMNPSKMTNLSSDPVAALPDAPRGTASIRGYITDHRGGHPIAGAGIYIRGYRTGTSSDIDGQFELRNIKAGSIAIVIRSVGYADKIMAISVPENGQITLHLTLDISTDALNEVVVTALGIQRKRDFGYTVSSVSNRLGLALQGRVAGVNISGAGSPGRPKDFMIRGQASFPRDQQLLYVVDGILYDEVPGNISSDGIDKVTVLKGPEATALYGARGANGVVVISTKTKTLRTQFRDYAYWIPEIQTDQHGEAKFMVEYPDNVSGWQNYVLGIDRKRRVGKSVSIVKSFKPLLAELSTPGFLIEGDSVELVGKTLNHSTNDYQLQTLFNINGHPGEIQNSLLKANESGIQRFPILAMATDTVKATYSLQSSTGFKDGEEQQIPVLPKGSREARGRFWVLGSDTTVSFDAQGSTGRLECQAQNNTLDLLLSELDHLKKYPYACMEQTASKLTGLLMEKKIRAALHQPFGDEKLIGRMTARLQKNQLYDGGWSWWPNGKTDLTITNYVMLALLPMRTDAVIETNIRNGLLYLQNQLPGLQGDNLLSTLMTMSEAGHVLDYKTWLDKLKFDSLSADCQWIWIKIRQRQKLEYETELKTLLGRGIRGIPGDLHWGENNYRWYEDATASTVVAYEVLEKEKDRDRELDEIIQYFFAERNDGHWENTVASARIVSTILPRVLRQYQVNQPARVTISGDTSFVVDHYPYRLSLSERIRRLSIQKSGGGITYFSLYQDGWNTQPQPNSEYYRISSHFTRNERNIDVLRAGEKIKMIVDVEAYRDADYLMLEIPIPAGCAYGEKTQDDYFVHREYLKDKVVLFPQKLTKGHHEYVIELESRYSGTFTLNPVKVSLMYFPTFFGRNEMKKTTIR